MFVPIIRLSALALLVLPIATTAWPAPMQFIDGLVVRGMLLPLLGWNLVLKYDALSDTDNLMMKRSNAVAREPFGESVSLSYWALLLTTQLQKRGSARMPRIAVLALIVRFVLPRRET